MEMDRIIESNGVIRELFKDFLGSREFDDIITLMRVEKMPIGKIPRGEHILIIEDYYQTGSDTIDAQEMKAEQCGKYFHIAIVLNGNHSKAIGAHRIVHPDWWDLKAPPADVSYLVASCWLHAGDFYDDHGMLEKEVREVLTDVNPNELERYAALI